ncbi:MerR family transcriptional regulator [Aliikangiella coralliicola]|uniref:MerR family transcriptional regulator n=2 Tax=Aliikangiella coralliicola TaxID=2592383 RepID=A0A545UGT5_9GAMM|nr:MerR family transcriptional regulator [Aliikangiella coralliicola]
MLTISKLARRFKISRATLLYYEKEGLLTPASRTENGYRWYGEKEISNLETILNYRSFGISIPDIKHLLINSEKSRQKTILTRQFDHLGEEIQKLRQQQLAIVNFLGDPETLKQQNMTKEKWTDIMRMSGMNDEDMRNWHRQFEKLEPAAHQEFLESLQISTKEIKVIRTWSKA